MTNLVNLKGLYASIYQRKLFYGTIVLISLNSLLFVSFGFHFYTDPHIVEIPTTSRLFAIIESVIGKNLSCYDFIQVLIHQLYGLMDGKFKTYSISFFVYLLLCKIWLTGYVAKDFVNYNLGLQFIILLQIFLIIDDYHRKKRENEKANEPSL